MNDLPSDLPRLRTLEAWLGHRAAENHTVGRYLWLQLSDVRARIAALEQGRPTTHPGGTPDGGPEGGPAAPEPPPPGPSGRAAGDGTDTAAGSASGDPRRRRSRAGGRTRGPTGPPPEPDWKIETDRLGGRRGQPLYVHRGDCGMGQGRAIEREQARHALAGGVDACPFCRPDTDLGIGID